MTDKQWQRLVDVIDGKVLRPLPVGFIIDSPWLPGWAGISTLDYFSSGQMWFEANIRAVSRFPEVIFLPGFWAEFGMCTEPSAFGSKCRWQENAPPHPLKVLTQIGRIDALPRPDPATDGLLPMVLKRLKHFQNRIEQAGHYIKFAVSRGPLNVSAFLMGTTEFLTAIRTEPKAAGRLLQTVTEFIIDWLRLQASAFPSIDGILVLDDIVGFLGDEDFNRMALPYLQRIFEAVPVKVKFFHNDAPGLVCAPYLSQMGINLFNFSFEHSLAQMKELTGNRLTLLGNLPPRDLFAQPDSERVADGVKQMLDSLDDKSRIIFSCGGGMPPELCTENIEAFVQTVAQS